MSQFHKNLLLACYQFVGDISSGQVQGYSASIAAGLPAFCSGWSRCWGRDTFIAFKGALLIPGLIKEAEEQILQYAQMLRHGILPNLLNKGENPRYNCRDACWWFIKAVKDYIEFTLDTEILKRKINLNFLDDNMEIHFSKKQEGVTKQMLLSEVI